MFCPNCGTKNEDDAVFCANCGTSLTQEQSQGTEEAVQAQPEVAQAQPVQEPVQPQVEGTQPQAAQPEQVQFNNQAQFNNQTQFNGQPQFNGQAQMGQPMQNQFAGQQAQPKAPKKPLKITKKMIGIGAAVVVVLAAIITFICVGSSASNYKNTAKKYMQAYLKCDWDTAYGMINLPDSEFLTKEAYAAVNKDQTAKPTAVITVMDDFSSMDFTAGAAVGKGVKVNYSTPGESNGSKSLTMDVSPKKFMLFFKQYKVSSDTLVCSDVKVSVPSSATLYINGVQVGDGYKTDNTSSSSKSSTTYKIPYLFVGNNTFKVTSDVFEDYEVTQSVDEYNNSFSVSTSKMKLKSEMTSTLKTQAETDLKLIADSCVAKKDVSAISSRVESSALTNVTKYYKYALEDCHSSYKDVTALTLSNITASVDASDVYFSSSDGLPTISVDLKYSFTGTYSTSSSTGKSGKGSSSYDSITYKYVDGTWKIGAMNINLSIY